MMINVDFSQKSLQWLKDEQKRLENLPQNWQNDIKIYEIEKAVLERDELEDSSDDGENVKQNLNDLNIQYRKEAHEEAWDGDLTSNKKEKNTDYNISDQILEYTDDVSIELTLAEKDFFGLFITPDETDQILFLRKYHRQIKINEDISCGALKKIFNYIVKEDKFTLIDFYLKSANFILSDLKMEERKINLLIDVLYYFCLDSNRSKLCLHSNDLTMFSALIIGDEDQSEFDLIWRNEFLFFVEKVNKIEYTKRAKLLDVIFSILPKQSRSDELRYFLYYKLLLDYLNDVDKTFDIKQFEILEIYKEKYPQNPTSDTEEQKLFFKTVTQNLKTFGKMFLTCIQVDERPKLLSWILFGFNFLTFQNVDIQIQLFESLPAELSLKNDGERNVELLPLETQVTSMQQIWKKYELFLNKKKNRTKKSGKQTKVYDYFKTSNLNLQ